MYLDTKIYNQQNLKPEDRAFVQELEKAKAELLCQETLEEYLEMQYGKAYLTAKLIGEQLEPFMDFLKQRWDSEITNLIISSIDGYTEQEFNEITSKNQNLIRERVAT